MESRSIKEEDAHLSFDQNEKKAEEDKAKRVEREQFGWWGIISFIVLLLMILFFLKKKKLI